MRGAEGSYEKTRKQVGLFLGFFPAAAAAADLVFRSKSVWKIVAANELRH